MLNEIRKLFRRSVEAFREELATREPEDQVAELLTAMRRELVAARAALPRFEADIAGARVELAGEREALLRCERRGSLAEQIGDAETVRVAAEFAVRHRERIVVLEQKVGATEAELALRRREAEEMKRRYQEADANRFALLAQLRRAKSAENMRQASSTQEGPLADWLRVEEKVERDVSYVDALGELEESPSPPPSASDPGAVDARLQELKRRMGRTRPT
jgi:phage shock protein A